MANLSPAQAAAEIVALINSRVRSPRQDELEDIIGKVLPSAAVLSAGRLPEMTPATPQPPSPDLVAYRATLAEEAACEHSGTEAQWEALFERTSAIEDKVWATRAQTPADLLLIAEIALYHENGVMESLDDPDAYRDERAVAQLIRAAIDVLGGHGHAR